VTDCLDAQLATPRSCLHWGARAGVNDGQQHSRHWSDSMRFY